MMGCVIARKRERRERWTSRQMPRVAIRVGASITPECTQASKMKVVFVFGGPGSRKGRIVNDLMQGFGFHVINAEKLILNKLPEMIKLGNSCQRCKESVDTTKAMEMLLKRNPDLLTLQWVLELVSNELQHAAKMGQYYCLVDLVPNLRSMLEVPAFIKDCGQEMGKFEIEWPCLFALHLSIPQDKVVESLGLTVTKNNSFFHKGVMGDEKDILKTKKRYEEYSASVKEFLSYFERSERLANVDVSCGVADLIWSTVSEFFCRMGFAPKMAVNTVIVFAFREEDISALDLKKYRMELIHIDSLLQSPDYSAEELFIALNEYIDQAKSSVESFVVHLENSPVLQQLQEKKDRHIIFLDEDDSHLHHYIYVGACKKDRSDSLFSLPFKAVSTTENEICLFPEKVETGLCRQVAMLYADTKSVVNRRKDNQELTVHEENRSL